MRTIKPFSTIAYCDKFFLIQELDKLIDNQTLDFYAFVIHQPEEDEKKVHAHLFMIPTRTFDTSTLKPILSQADPLNPTKPKSILPVRPSKFGDWYLYNTHNSLYLASKMQRRKYHYVDDDFITSDRDYFIELKHEIDMSTFMRTQFIREAVEHGTSFEQLLSQGIIPPQQVMGYEKIYEALWRMIRDPKSSIMRRLDNDRWGGNGRHD